MEEVIEATGGKPLSSPVACSVGGVSIDSRTARPGDLFVAIRGENFDGHDFVRAAMTRGALYALVSDVKANVPDEVRARLIVVGDTTFALGRLAAHYRSQLATAIIAVTGSNGKTTTRAMIDHVLSARKRGRCAIKNYNNQIGVPLTLLLAEPADEFLVVEIGTNAPGEVDYLGSLVKPDVAVITNVGPAHLERLIDLEGVAREKSSLLGHVKRRGLAAINTDAPELRTRISQAGDINVVTFGMYPESDLTVTQLEQVAGELRFEVNGRLKARLKMLGKHNAINALASLIVGRRFGLTDEEILHRLADFELPDMRLQVHQFGHMIVINDCYNANPASMRSALEVLCGFSAPGRRVAVVGDMRELGNSTEQYHMELGRLIGCSLVDCLIAVGEHADLVCQSARDTRRDPLQLHSSAHVEQLVELLPTLIRPTDTVLLKGSRFVQLEKLLNTIAQIGRD